MKKQTKNARLELLAEALEFLKMKPGGHTKNFMTFGDVRRKLEIEGQTREELRQRIFAEFPGNCLGEG